MNLDNKDMQEVKSNLLAWFQNKLPEAEDLVIIEFEKPGMGLSSETYLLTLGWKESGLQKSQGMVLRAAPQKYKIFPEYELSHQFRTMQVLEKTNVPVAKMLWMENDASFIGSPFYLMERLLGEVPQDYPSYHGSGMFFDATPEARAKMWWGTLEAMVEIHRLDWKKLGLSFLGAPTGGTDPVDRQLAYWQRYFEWVKSSPGESHPILEASMKWLQENRYASEHVALCWGDARMGNTLFSIPERDVLAIMDWEMAFIGDPECDLAWSILLDRQHSLGAGLPRCEGTPGYEETVERYEALTGWKVKHLFYNEVFCAVRYGMILVSAFRKFSQQGIPIEEDMILNNVCTQHLSDLLDLPSPGPRKQVTASVGTMTVSVQFHFTGPNGYDWYLISDKGVGTRYDGIVDHPDCTVRVALEDWKAIQSGRLDRLEAWSSGKLVTEGDLNIMVRLEDLIAEFTDF